MELVDYSFKDSVAVITLNRPPVNALNTQLITDIEAAIGLAESLAIAHGDQGIKVSVLCPQAVRTGMTAGTEGGGVAGVDGMIEADEVADVVVEGLASERFLILPHPTVETYMQRKTGDYDRWLAGMRKLRARFEGGP